MYIINNKIIKKEETYKLKTYFNVNKNFMTIKTLIYDSENYEIGNYEENIYLNEEIEMNMNIERHIRWVRKEIRTNNDF